MLMQNALGQPRLTDATRTGDCNDRVLLHDSPQRAHVVVAAIERRRRHRQSAVQWRCLRRCRGERARRRAFLANRRSKTVAATRHRSDRRVSEQLAQRDDLDLEIVFLDNNGRPHKIHQLVLADGAITPLD